MTDSGCLQAAILAAMRGDRVLYLTPAPWGRSMLRRACELAPAAETKVPAQTLDFLSGGQIRFLPPDPDLIRGLRVDSFVIDVPDWMSATLETVEHLRASGAEALPRTTLDE